ncbi:MAG: ABC transporter permease subunit [Anaerolineae bacterium]|nr:ABC transporter permease subunit [Anaerolineae bacterium]
MQRGNLRGGWVGLLLVLGVFGVLLPYQSGRSWVDSPLALVYWAWLPLFLVISVVADSFAGERERHTLEALLATRLSDGAILLGKVVAAVAYGWGLTMIAVILGLITVNLFHGEGELVLYGPLAAVSIPVITLLASLLAASAGVLVSLRASSVRQAAQTLSIAVMILLFVPLFGFQLLPPEWQTRLATGLADAKPTAIVVGAVAVLGLLDAGLLAAARARFRRARLIL